MLIILNCAHTQVEEVVCQSSRTEWSTAVCDSCVAQLGETDNPQPAGADKTATFLLRRMKIPSAGPCSHSLPPLCHALSLSLWKVGPLSSSLFVSPLHRSPLQCPLHISLQGTAAYGEHLTGASWGSERELQGSIIIFLTAPSTVTQKLKQNSSWNTSVPRICARVQGRVYDKSNFGLMLKTTPVSF